MSHLPRIEPSGVRDLQPRWVAIGVAAALLLRALAWLLLGDSLPTHGYESGVISDNLLAGRGYFMNFYFTQTPVHSFIPPFYPMLMTGLKALSEHWVALLRILQILASVANVFLAAELAGRWFGRRAMRWVFVLMILYPIFVIYSLAIFSTTFIMSFVLILVNLMDRLHEPRPVGLGAVTGLVHGLAILTSPPLALLGVLFLFRLWRWKSPGRRRRTAAYLVALLLVWSPWLIRNWHEHGQVLLTSTNGGFNFLVGNNPYASGYTWGELTEETFWNVIDPEAVETLSEPELEFWFYRRALSYIAADPVQYAGLFLRKVYYFWWCQDVTRFGYPPLWSMAYQALYAVFLPFVLVGLYVWRFRWRRLFPAYFILAEYSFLYGAYFVRSRFRWEIEALLLIFAVAGLLEVVRRARDSRHEVKEV